MQPKKAYMDFSIGVPMVMCKHVLLRSYSLFLACARLLRALSRSFCQFSGLVVINGDNLGGNYPNRNHMEMN